MISVIVPVRNAMPWLEDQLRALSAQECDEPWEVVVADNNSTDDSRLVAQRWVDRSTRIRLVDASRVRGPGARGTPGSKPLMGKCWPSVMLMMWYNPAG